MKKIYILFCLLISLAFVSCSEEEEQLASLDIMESDVSYDSVGGEGNIKINALNPVTASSSEEWCTIKNISNDLITISVGPNYNESSRSAMINISSGDESAQVPIYQMGSILDTNLTGSEIYSDGGELSFFIKSNNNVVITSSAKWLTYKYEGEKLTLNISSMPSNSSTFMREAVLNIVCGKSEFEYKFTQINMEGVYTCTCIERDGERTYTLRLEETDIPFVYNVFPKDSYYDGPYQVRYSNRNLIIGFNQVLGLYQEGPKKVILCSYDKKGQLSWNTNIQYVAPVDVNSNSLKFQDNGTWSGYHVDGFYYSISDDNGNPTGNGYYSTDLVWVKTDGTLN